MEGSRNGVCGSEVQGEAVKEWEERTLAQEIKELHGQHNPCLSSPCSLLCVPLPVPLPSPAPSTGKEAVGGTV